jgi:hypothetical protein
LQVSVEQRQEKDLEPKQEIEMRLVLQFLDQE